MKGDALQTFQNISSPTPENLGENLALFFRKHINCQSMATAKHKIQKFVCNPPNQKLVYLPDELSGLKKDAIRIAVRAIIEQFIHAKMPAHLRKTIKQALLENGTFEQMVTHLQWEIKPNDLEVRDELQANTVNQYATKNSEKPKQTCQHCNKPGQIKNQGLQLKKQEEKPAHTVISSGNISGVPTNSNCKTNNNNRNSNKKIQGTQNSLTSLWDKWQNEPIHREMLIWS